MASITFYGQTVTVNDLSCTNVKPAATAVLNWYGWTASACTSDPVGVNTIIIFSNPAAGQNWQSQITAVVDNPTPTTPGGTTGSQTCTPEPFEYAYAAQVWSGAFSVTVGLYLIAFKVGTILKMFKRF